MFTLTDASYETKQIIKWSAIIFAAIFLAVLLFRIGVYIKNIIAPTPPPKPTVFFGRLPSQAFLQNATNQNLTYSIYTLSGTLPNFTGQLKVYRMQQVQPDLLAVNKFESKAINIGFAPGSKAISNNVFQWQSNNYVSNIPMTLSFNVVNNDFTLTSNYISNPDVLAGNNLRDETNALYLTNQMLQNMNALTDDIDQTKTHTNLFSIKNNSLVPATSLSNAQIIEVDYYQQNVDNLPIYYENPNSSNITVLVSGGQSQAQIVGAKYIHQLISGQFSTYPIKTTQQAYDDLKQGKGYIASYFGTSPNITITNVFLAYYIGSQTQDFLMPVFVFQGNNGFYAYVPAVTDEWINM